MTFVTHHPGSFPASWTERMARTTSIEMEGLFLIKAALRSENPMKRRTKTHKDTDNFLSR
jgi:hypothetical protein